MTPFRRILVPHDFSDHATGALRMAARLVPAGGRLVVLHVVVPFTPITDVPPMGMAAYVPPDDLLDAAKKQLDRQVAKAGGPPRGVRVDTVVELGDPYQCIMDATRGMDLIVMSTAGRTGIAHLVIGSVTEKVVRHSTIPVLTVRPGAARKAVKKRRA
jgi:nucleotide-binding universal stress UspA family protein